MTTQDIAGAVSVAIAIAANAILWYAILKDNARNGRK